ncbi:hypothetical protein MMC20_001203 [Loxospora ochrophaea]|nr:hypothetical protein [Loxospora ochrophaea]
MPVVQQRHQPLAFGSNPGNSNRNSADSNVSDGNDGTIQRMWIINEGYELPQKEMDFPSAKLSSLPSRRRAKSNIHITALSKSELQDRYLSSEEEASPSPDDEVPSHEDSIENCASQASENDSVELSTPLTSHPAIAVAVPIFSVGRPKLVDITNIAPLQKRKRINKPQSHFTHKRITLINENMPNESIKPVTPPTSSIPKRKESLPVPQPDSWLTEDDIHPLVERDEDHYFPDTSLDYHMPTRYADYDPYSLEPPRLGHSASITNINMPYSRGSSSSPANNTSLGWKGLTKSLSLTKKHNGGSGDRQIRKKPKMVARGANERRELPVIPPFPFND